MIKIKKNTPCFQIILDALAASYNFDVLLVFLRIHSKTFQKVRHDHGFENIGLTYTSCFAVKQADI